MDNPRARTHSWTMDPTQTPSLVHASTNELVAAEFGAGTADRTGGAVRYLNTASQGLLPERSAAVLRTAVSEMTAGTLDMVRCFEQVDAARASFAALAGVAAEQVAVGTSVAVHVGLVAASLPPGSRVLTVEGDFASVVNPFAVRDDLHVRAVPLAELADTVTADTDLVAFSAVQSADGRIADLDGVRAAARRHGCRTLVDATQAAGWLPLDLGRFDYAVCGAYKWLLCPRGTSFLVVTDESGPLLALHASWVAGESPWEMCYGPVPRPAPGARRYDEPVPFLPYLAAAESLRLLAGIGVDRVAAHNTGLAARFRAAASGAGLAVVPGDSAIVSLPGLGEEGRARAARAGVGVSVRAGDLRAAFHLYNTEADADALLRALTA